MGERSFFHPYIDSLPSDPPQIYKNISRTIGLLRKYNSPVEHRISDYIERRNKTIEKIGTIIQNDEELSFAFRDINVVDFYEDWMQTLLILSSRIFWFDNAKDKKPVEMIIPFFDMVNTDPHPNLSYDHQKRNNEINLVVISHPWRRGKGPNYSGELFIDYHDDNHGLLKGYGLIYEDNPNDEYVLGFINLDDKNVPERDLLFADAPEDVFLDNLTNVLLKLSNDYYFGRNGINEMNVRPSHIRYLLESQIPFVRDFSLLHEDDDSIDNGAVMKFIRFEKSEMKKTMDYLGMEYDDEERE